MWLLTIHGCEQGSQFYNWSVVERCFTDIHHLLKFVKDNQVTSFQARFYVSGQPEFNPIY